MGKARLGHYLLGIEGVALIRRGLVAEPQSTRRRLEEMARLLETMDEGLASIELDAPELDAIEGYRSWAATYDDVPNPLIRAEEPAVRVLLDDAPIGRALDAACGTARYAAYLGSRGHRVIGVDASSEMLACARKRSPDVEFREGDLRELPMETARFDLVVCALALAHLDELASAKEVGLIAGPMLMLAPEAFRDALVGLPAAVV